MPPRDSSRPPRRTRCFPTRRNAANMTVPTVGGSGELRLILENQSAVGPSPQRFLRGGPRRPGPLWASRKLRRAGRQTLRPNCGWCRKRQREAARWRCESPSASRARPAKDTGIYLADRARPARDKGQSGNPDSYNCGSRQGSAMEPCCASPATARQPIPMQPAAIFTSWFACGLVGKGVPAHTP